MKSAECTSATPHSSNGAVLVPIPMHSPTVAVLCVTHGRPELVRQCLESCATQDYPGLEVIVIVNPIDELTEEVVRTTVPGAKIIRTHRNLGFFPALNIALANTDADYVMVVDDDAWFLASDALSCLVAEFEAEPRLGAVTCNLEGPNETPIQGGDQYIREFTTGFTMFPRKAVSEWVDYFPDVFFRSAGEAFLCTQLWEQRRPVKRVEKVRMFHALAKSGRSMRDWRFYGLRSQILCSVMREPFALLPLVIISKFIKSFIQYAKFISPGIWLQAWLSAAVHFPVALRQRRPISLATRRLLTRLGTTPVYDLESLPEWRFATSRSSSPATGSELRV